MEIDKDTGDIVDQTYTKIPDALCDPADRG